MYKQSLGVGLLGVLLCQNVVCDESVERRLADKLKAVLPEAKVTRIQPAAVPGLYEVVLGNDIVYISKDGRYALTGDLRDLDQRRNLTEEHRGQARLDAFKSLKPDTMIEFAPAKTKYFVYVFTDVDCTYCRKFHKEVATLNQAGIAVRYLAFPRAGIGSESYQKTVSVWCAKDRKAALTNAKNGEQIPAANCPNPVTEQYELGKAMGVRGTPTIILANGQELGGYVPAPQLVQYVAGGAALPR